MIDKARRHRAPSLIGREYEIVSLWLYLFAKAKQGP